MSVLDTVSSRARGPADVARGPRRPFPCRDGPVSFRVSGRCRALRGSTSRFRAPVADRVLSSRTLPSLPTQPLRARYHPGLQAVRRRPHRRTSPACRSPRASRANENPAGFARDARRGGDRDDRRDTRNAGTTACRYAFTGTRVALSRNTRGRVDATRRRRSSDRASRAGRRRVKARDDARLIENLSRARARSFDPKPLALARTLTSTSFVCFPSPQCPHEPDEPHVSDQAGERERV